MTPQELKNSILQLAIQGKLVEQRPEEGTAQELHRQIQEEKRRLIQEGKLKANKKIEPISDDIIPFDIPDSWIWIRFGNLVNYTMGKTPPRAEPEWWGRDMPWVSIADMPESGHICETKEYVTSAAIVKKFGNKFSPAGTLLMSFKLTVGRVSILDIDAVHNEAIISIYPLVDDGSIEKMYLFYVLPFVSRFGERKNAIKGTTLNDTSICNLLLPLPPLAEQKRIVAKIEELLPYVHRYEQAWNRLEEFQQKFPIDMRQSLLRWAIQGRLVEQRREEGTAEGLYRQVLEEKQRLIAEKKIKANKKIEPISDDIIPFDIPDSWMWVRFGDLVHYSMGKTPPRAEAEWWGRDFPWVSIADMPEGGHIRETKERVTSPAVVQKFGNKISPAGTLLMSFKLTVGRVSILDIDAVHNEAIISIYPFVDEGGAEKMYLFYVLPFIAQSGESKNAIKGKTLNDTSICNLLIPLPPLPEQRRIVARLEELLPLCKRLK